VRPAAAPGGRRRRVVVAGALIAAAYVAVALTPSWFAGPATRRPLLDDGAGPAVPYRWVDPPKALAPGNQPPSSISAKVPMGSGGSKAAAVSTSDVQITLVVTQGMISASSGATQAGVRLDPLAPKGFPPAPSGLRLAGNVYRIRGTYLPSKKPFTGFTHPGTAVLIYPQLATVHSTGHEMLYSADGRRWQLLGTQDIVGLVQVQAKIPGTGYVAVAGRPRNPAASTATSAGGNTVRIAIAVVLGCIALVGIGFLIRLLGKKE
jgi:hypothetical protein